MRYFELTCTAYLKNDINFKESFEILAKYISFSMAQYEELKITHEARGFKHYTFGGLIPIEKERVYKKGSTYNFTMRSVDENLINLLSKELRKNIKTSYS
jgi:CRISPR-associated endoribonuclease Cas6